MKSYYKDEWVTIYHGDCREILPQLPKVDLVLTDPPYGREYLPLYSLLASSSRDLLVDGGSLATMAGQSYLDEVMGLLSEYLSYHWIIAYLTPGAQSAQLWQKKVNTFWKPILWYINGEYNGKWIGDVSKSLPNDNDKTYHKWGQSISGTSDLIIRLSELKDLILDPFLGSGTTCYCAKKLNRKCIGIEIEEKYCEISANRCRQEVFNLGVI